MKETISARTGALILFATLVPVGAAARAAADARPSPARKVGAAKPAPAGVPAEIKLLLAKAPKAADYPNAGKATLLDLADIVVRPDGSARTVTRQLIKVFNERGRDEAEVKIPYNSAFETVTITRARTIKPDGRVMPVKPADIRDHGVDEGGDSYSDARVKSFSLPAVDNNCLLDYEYVTDQKTSAMPGQFWSRWWFQSGLDPVLLSRLTVTAPKSLSLNQELRNTAVKPVVKALPDNKRTVTTWEARNVPPIEPEPFMPGIDRIAPHLALSTLRSWQDIAAWYWKLAQGRMTADAAIKAQVARLTKGKTTPEEKARAIFYWVEEKTRYVALEYGIGGYQPRRAVDVFANNYGDCKDMTTLLVAMLREAGVTAHPVLLRAGSTDKVSDDLPSPGAFNHALCLAEIGGKKFWLDATAELCPWGAIPGGDRGAEAFVIRDGVGAFEVIPHAAPDENRIEQNITLALAEDGSAKGTVRLTGTGDRDMELRAAFTYLRPDKVKDFLERMAQSIGPNARVGAYTISDFRNKDLPISVTYDITLPSWAKKSGSLLLFKAKPEQSGGSSSSPFQRDQRRHPVLQPSAALGASTLDLTLPPGFSILSLPDGSEVKSDLGRFRRTIASRDDRITISVRGENFRADVPPARYDEVRRYYDEYLKAADETIVIKKG